MSQEAGIHGGPGQFAREIVAEEPDTGPGPVMRNTVMDPQANPSIATHKHVRVRIRL